MRLAKLHDASTQTRDAFVCLSASSFALSSGSKFATHRCAAASVWTDHLHDVSGSLSVLLRLVGFLRCHKDIRFTHDFAPFHRDVLLQDEVRGALSALDSSAKGTIELRSI